MGCLLVSVGGIFALLAALGWGLNIYKIIKMKTSPITAELVIRGGGIVFVPVGAVAGWIPIQNRE